MGQFLNNPALQITAAVVAGILLSVGRKKMLPHTGRNKPLLWIAFIITVVCGLLFGVALSSVVKWITGFSGGAGEVVGSLGQIAAFTFGWWAVYLSVALVRDLMDGTPDEDARKAALWIPTAMPAGWAAVMALLQDPRGLGTSLKAAIMGAITLAFCVMTINAALRGQKGQVGWKWFAAAVALLAGLVITPALAYIFALVAPWIERTGIGIGSTHLRIILGALGIALFLAGLVDLLKDKMPDALFRKFLMYGLPCVLLGFGVAFNFIAGTAGDGLNNVTGSIG